MSNTEQLVIMPRPRSAWQAIDVGFKVARAHYLKLMVLWLALATPFWLACEAINLLGNRWGIFLWWWFKPYYELPLLLYLSKVVFSDTAPLGACIKTALRSFWPMMKSYTGLSRLSPNRATTAGVVFLEHQSGAKRRARAQVLTGNSNRAFTMLLGCFHIELILTYLMLGIAMYLAPDYLEVLLPELMEGELSAGAQAIADGAVLLAGALVAPFFVGAGFLIYINRRMQLEAWDIEHQFKQINAAQQAKPAFGPAKLAVPLMLCVSVFAAPVEHNFAQDDQQTSTLTPAGAQQAIEKVLSHRDFGGTEKRKIPKFPDREAKARNWDSIPGIFKAFASIVEALLWLAAIIAVVLIVQFVLKFKPDLQLNAKLKRPKTQFKSAEHHPLTQALPDDIATAAERQLNNGDNRGALSLLFRGALRALMTQHDVEVASSATESDCVSTLSVHASASQMDAFKQLIKHWQREAYAHLPHNHDEISGLITHWRTHFSANEVKAS